MDDGGNILWVDEERFVKTLDRGIGLPDCEEIKPILKKTKDSAPHLAPKLWMYLNPDINVPNI
jgi:hypothetical protein